MPDNKYLFNHLVSYYQVNELTGPLVDSVGDNDLYVCRRTPPEAPHGADFDRYINAHRPLAEPGGPVGQARRAQVEALVRAREEAEAEMRHAIEDGYARRDALEGRPKRREELRLMSVAKLLAMLQMAQSDPFWAQRYALLWGCGLERACWAVLAGSDLTTTRTGLSASACAASVRACAEFAAGRGWLDEGPLEFLARFCTNPAGRSACASAVSPRERDHASRAAFLARFKRVQRRVRRA